MAIGKLLGRTAGIEFGKAQYRGGAAILTDLIGGHIDIGMDSMAADMASVRDGKIRGIGDHVVAALVRFP